MGNILVITVTYNFPEEDLKRFLDQVKKNEVNTKDIIVIDNSKKNRGYAGGVNKAVKENLHKYPFFLIINPDTLLHKGAIKAMFSILESDSSIGIVGPKILDEAGRIWSLGGILDKKRYSGGLIGYGMSKERHTFADSIDFISGTAMMVRKEVFKKIGLFTNDYFLYYEDVDFSVRAIKANFKLAIAPQAVITHFASTTIGKNSPAQQYYMARNHLLFLQRFAPFYIKARELVRLPKTLWQARNKRYELLGIRDYFLRRFEKRDYWG